jgi:hypothetical protein
VIVDEKRRSFEIGWLASRLENGSLTKSINELAQMINLSNGHMSKGRRFSKTTIDGISNVKELSNIINLFNTYKVGSFFFQRSPFIVVARQNCFATKHCTRML